jgi:hypothetical protein
MKPLKQLKGLIMLLLTCYSAIAQKQGVYKAIYSGIPWFDNRGKVVSAHGANIVRDNGRFYLFGEAHADTSNAFTGFNCYSSSDLYNWKFERVALPVQETGRLGPNRVGERPKVLKCPKTGEYVMLMHTDSLGYKDPCVGYATSKTISGPFVFQGPLLYKGEAIRKWDMGSFQDADGSGYLLIHGGLIYKLTDDFKGISEQMVDNKWNGHEAPAIFKKGNIYYWLASDLTSWERNDNFYYTATSLKGPWTARGIFAPKGSLTWNSQTTFVLQVAGSKDTTYMFMGDRWSFPHQASSATYMWQPIDVSGTAISIPKFLEAWQINPITGKAVVAAIGGKVIEHTNQNAIIYKGHWLHLKSDSISVSRSDVKGDSYSVKFNGTQVGFYGIASLISGYASVILTNNKGKKVVSSMIDMYSKYSVKSLLFLTPVLAKDDYTLTVSVEGEHGSWSDKKKNVYGSKGNFVSLDKIVIK